MAASTDMKCGARIVGTGIGVPERTLTNDDLSRMVDTSDEWITTRTGMKVRHIVAPHEAASDLAHSAAKEALQDAGLTAKDLDIILVATVTPDMPFPSTACILQDKLGARNVPAFDLAAGCTGSIYALSLADQLVRCGMVRHVLVIGVEILSKITNWSDRTTCILFGDAAGAIVLSPSDDPERGILHFTLHSDGSRTDSLYMPGGGSRHPATHETVERSLHYLYMRGNEIFRVAVNTMSQSVQTLMDRANLPMDELGLLIPHQANLRIIEAVAKKLGIPRSRVLINIERYGNTSSASTLLGLHEARLAGRVPDGGIVVMVAFGAGLTWGGVLMRW